LDKRVRRKLESYDQYLEDTIEADVLEAFKERAARYAVDDTNLDEDVMLNAADMDYVGHLLTAQRTICLKLEMKLKSIKATKRKEIKRHDPRNAKSGGPTIDDITAMLDSDLEIAQATVELRKVEAAREHMEEDLKAAAQKARMLEITAARQGRKAYIKKREEY